MSNFSIKAKLSSLMFQTFKNEPKPECPKHSVLERYQLKWSYGQAVHFMVQSASVAVFPYKQTILRCSILIM